MNAHVRNYFGLAMASLFATYAIYEKFMLPELQIPMVVSIIFVSVFFIFYKIRKFVPETENYAKVAYVLFSIFMTVGDSFKQYNSFFGIWGNPFINSDILEELLEEFSSYLSVLNGFAGNLLMLFSAICKTVGYYFIIKFSIEVIKYYGKSFLHNNKKTPILERFFSGRVFLKSFIIFTLAWLPYLLVVFPENISRDAAGQIKQFLTESITTHHPFFTTLIYGFFAKLGVALGNVSAGIAIYTILQYVFVAASFAYCIVCAYYMCKNRVYCFAILLLFSLFPAVPYYATSVVKDTLYATLFMLYIVQILLIFYNDKHAVDCKKNLLCLSVISFFVCLCRNNGIYAVAPTALLLLLYFGFKKDTDNKKRFCSASLLLIPLLLYAGYNFIQYDVMKLEKGSVREALSIPFQQTARYVKEHPKDVTAQESAIIDRVLDYGNLTTLYNPIVSDPVKGTYKNADGALKDYFKVWGNQFKRHPLTYVEATVNMNYFLVYPDEANTRIYGGLAQAPKTLPQKFVGILLMMFSMGLSCVPIVSCVVNPVTYIWILMYLIIRGFFKKQRLLLLVLFPLFIQMLTIIAGPAVFNHPRYIFPICWAIPFIIAYYLSIKQKSE